MLPRCCSLLLLWLENPLVAESARPWRQYLTTFLRVGIGYINKKLKGRDVVLLVVIPFL
jgi:hypothetical protein